MIYWKPYQFYFSILSPNLSKPADSTFFEHFKNNLHCKNISFESILVFLVCIECFEFEILLSLPSSMESWGGCIGILPSHFLKRRRMQVSSPLQVAIDPWLLLRKSNFDQIPFVIHLVIHAFVSARSSLLFQSFVRQLELKKELLCQ